MERHYHNNPWADKLSEVSVPDGGEAWKAMALLLDKEMPGGNKRDKRRWFLLVILLLLLIGVCNCPGRGRFLGHRYRSGAKDSISAAGGEVDGGGRVRSGGDGATVRGDGGEATVRDGGDRPKLAGGDTLVFAGRGHDNVVEEHRGIDKNRDIDRKGGSGTGGKRVHNHHAKPGEPGAAEDEETNRPGEPVLRDDGIAGKDSTLIPNAVAKKDSVLKTPAKPMVKPVSKPASKPVPKPAEEKKQKEKGWWTVGIGLNQFFTVGEPVSHYNSGGITGTLGDYIPVPMVRYHFNKKFFLQLEAQINSPQNTRKDLLISQSPVDSISPTQGSRNSVLIKKLFYFNVPLSIHYNVSRALDVGAGLQFSRLSNGIGLFQNQLINSVAGTIDSSSSLSKSFKGDTLYKKIKTNEFRVLLDASYTWRSFVFGIGYNQSLSKFINIQVSPGQVTQARNSSLQLYLRYILWDNQKKQPSMKK